MLIDSLQIHCEEARFVSRGNKKKKRKRDPWKLSSCGAFHSRAFVREKKKSCWLHRHSGGS